MGFQVRRADEKFCDLQRVTAARMYQTGGRSNEDIVAQYYINDPTIHELQIDLEARLFAATNKTAGLHRFPWCWVG
jgi:hypothetical protein